MSCPTKGGSSNESAHLNRDDDDDDDDRRRSGDSIRGGRISQIRTCKTA